MELKNVTVEDIEMLLRQPSDDGLNAKVSSGFKELASMVASNLGISLSQYLKLAMKERLTKDLGLSR